MLRAFVNAFKIPDLRKKILFTLGIIAIYRLGSHVQFRDGRFPETDSSAHDADSSGRFSSQS